MREKIAKIIETLLLILTLVLVVSALVWIYTQLEWLMYFIAYTFLAEVVLTIGESIL